MGVSADVLRINLERRALETCVNSRCPQNLVMVINVELEHERRQTQSQDRFDPVLTFIQKVYIFDEEVETVRCHSLIKVIKSLDDKCELYWFNYTRECSRFDHQTLLNNPLIMGPSLLSTLRVMHYPINYA